MYIRRYVTPAIATVLLSLACLPVFAQGEASGLSGEVIAIALFSDLEGAGHDVTLVNCPRSVGDLLIRPGSGCVFFDAVDIDVAMLLMDLTVDLFFTETLEWTRSDWIPSITSAFPVLERPLQSKWGQRYGVFMMAPTRYRESLMVITQYR